MGKFDMISIGDAVLDTFLKVRDVILVPSREEHNAMLCLPYADKIPVESFEQKPAGNAANNAIGLSRFGLKTAFYSVVGNDDSGKKIIAAVKKEKVSPAYLRVEKGATTNYTVVINYNGERTQLIYRLDRSYKLPKLAKSKWVYYTAVGKNHVNLEREIVDYVKKTGARLAFNPGAYQLDRGARALKKVLRVTSVLFVNKEEAYKLVGRGGIKYLLRGLCALGPETVIVTDGSRGAYASDCKEHYKMGVFKIKVVEMTGAGDAFATGVIAALHCGKKIDVALRWGTANSTSVISYIGPQEGLLDKAGIQKMLKKYTKVKPKKM